MGCWMGGLVECSMDWDGDGVEVKSLVECLMGWAGMGQGVCVWAELVVGKEMDLGGMLSGAGAKEASMGFSLAHWGMSSFEFLCVLDDLFLGTQWRPHERVRAPVSWRTCTMSS